MPGLGGEQLDELSSSGSWVHTNLFANGQLLATYQGTDRYFPFSDWLGTKRGEVGAGGCLETFTGLPFGSGLASSGNCPDATEHHFTGKERDAESGNDYFVARYYASSMGRFMSPDWAAQEEPVPYAQLDDPQSLNLYSYVRNNPLTRADADGHDPSDLVYDGSTHTLTLYSNSGEELGSWHANNNVDSRASLGKLPDGTYPVARPELAAHARRRG